MHTHTVKFWTRVPVSFSGDPPGDWTERSVVLLIWAVTGVVLYLICSFVLRGATNTDHAW